MTRLTVIGMAIIVCALAGCVDKRDVESLGSADMSLSNEVSYLRARVAAVEKACLQLNARLTDAENSKTAVDQAAISGSGSTSVTTNARESGRVTQTERVTLLSDSKPAGKLARGSFNRLVGMTLPEVLTLLGKPDKVDEKAGIQSWNYNAIILAIEGNEHEQEQSAALIVFENGCVSRAVLTTNEVQSSSESQGK